MPQAIPQSNLPAGFDVAGKSLLEGYELWKSGCEIWLDYLSALPAATTPAALMEANAKLMARCVQISGLASGALMKDAGLPCPTLNDE
jgi:hypothetical protein